MMVDLRASVSVKMSAVLDANGTGVVRAIAQGLNEGGDLVRTQVQKALWKQTGAIKYKSITGRMRTARAGQIREGGLSYMIIASGKGIPLKEFKVAVTGTGVAGFPWGVEHDFKRSFALGGGRFKARRGAARLPVRSLNGPALPKELVKGASAATFYREAERVVPDMILKRLARLL